MAPWILLKLKKHFILTVQQDARNIFFVADFFKVKLQAYFFYGIFYLRHPFPVFRKNLHFKVTQRQENLSTLFLNHGWLPLLKMIKINTLQLILVLLLSEKSDNMADFLKIFKKLSQSLLYVLHHILKKKWS